MTQNGSYFEGSDGTQLYYEIHGEGPDMVACNGIAVSTFFWKYLKEYFSSRYRFITWDYPGHGRSHLPRGKTEVSVKSVARDLGKLADHLSVRRPVLLGHSMGVQVILEYYRFRPEEVGALIPVLGSYGKPLDTFMNSRRSRPIFDKIVAMAERSPETAGTIFRFATNPEHAVPFGMFAGLVDRHYCPPHDLRQYLDHLQTLDIRFMLKLAVSMANHTAEEVLENIQVPTLIVAAERDSFTPIHLSFKMQRMIRNAEILVLRNGSHAALVEQPEAMIERIDEFVSAHGLA